MSVMLANNCSLKLSLFNNSQDNCKNTIIEFVESSLNLLIYTAH
jgi:hypothetical protein